MAALHARCFVTPRPWSAAEFAGFLADSLCFTLTAPSQEGPSKDLAGFLVGFLVGRVVAGEAEVLTLAVAPEARRQGIGARLLAAFLAEARARTAETAFLEVASDNQAALALYRAGGFAPVGLRPAYYPRAAAPALDAVVMARPV